MTPWDQLLSELDRWKALRQCASFWWRDDDASESSPALSRLLDLRRSLEVPLALAVIPGRLSGSLAEALPETDDLSVLQHGYSHRNHASEGAGKCELGDERPFTEVISELRTGRQALRRCFGSRFHPVMVPPWNRISPSVAEALPAAEWCGLSSWGPRSSPCLGSGVVASNVHVDIVNWRGDRGFVGERAAIDQVLAHLQGRRTGAAEAAEATGFMSHHLDHDQGCWDFCRRFIELTRAHSAVQWLGSRSVFALRPTSGR